MLGSNPTGSGLGYNFGASAGKKTLKINYK